MKSADFLKRSEAITSTTFPYNTLVGASTDPHGNMYAVYLGRMEPDMRTAATFVMHYATGGRTRTILTDTVAFSEVRHPSLAEQHGPKLPTIWGEMTLSVDGHPSHLGNVALAPIPLLPEHANV